MRARLIVALCMVMGVIGIVACGNGAPASSGNELIPVSISSGGDATKGATVFAEQGCTTCHNTNTSQLVGPGLAGVMTVAGPDYPNGVSYDGKLANGADRTEENIAAWIRTGGQGQIGNMSPHEMSDEDMAHLLAYLRTLQK